MQSTLEKQDQACTSRSSWTATAAGRERRGLPRSAGHREGIEAVRRVVEAAPDLGIGALTLFAFSSDNWRRPPLEVEVLMLLLRQYLRRDVRRLADNGVRLQGDRPARPAARRAWRRRSRTPKPPRARGTRLALNVALDYSARDAIANAAATWLGDDSPARAAFGRLLALPGPRHRARRRSVDPHRRREAALGFPAVGVRLRGARASPTRCGRTSAREHLRAALADFHARERRFGGLAVAAE